MIGRPPFTDRSDAGQKLAIELSAMSGPATVAAIPRGGVLVAAPVAERLHAPLAVVYARKLTAPVAPELAFGALDEDGEGSSTPASWRISSSQRPMWEAAKRRVAEEIRRRMLAYRTPPFANFLAPGRGLVLVDDGLATGVTMKAAVIYASRHGARDITVAVACASARAEAYFRQVADRFVSLVVDENLTAVGEYYEDFAPVTDEVAIATVFRQPGMETR
jgi:predicted phosphoribosyltransferase